MLRNQLQQSLPGMLVICQITNVELKLLTRLVLLNTRIKKKEVRQEVEHAAMSLSPGPHAIVMVLFPSRYAEEEKKVIEELKSLLRNDTFLQFTIIVKVRKK